MWSAGGGVHPHASLRRKPAVGLDVRYKLLGVSTLRGSSRFSVSRESNGVPTVFLPGGTSHREDAIHGEEVVFRQVSAMEESRGFQEQSLAF